MESNKFDYLKHYDNAFSKHPDYAANERPIFAETIQMMKEYKLRSIIDISSGRGLFLNMLRRNFKEAKLVCTDLRKYHNLDIEFHVVDLSNPEDLLKIIDHFDFLTCLDVIEHLGEQYLDDMFRFFQKISDNCIFSIANHQLCGWNPEHQTEREPSFWTPLIENYFIIKRQKTSGFPGPNATHFLYTYLVESKQ